MQKKIRRIHWRSGHYSRFDADVQRQESRIWEGLWATKQADYSEQDCQGEKLLTHLYESLKWSFHTRRDHRNVENISSFHFLIEVEKTS